MRLSRPAVASFSLLSVTLSACSSGASSQDVHAEASTFTASTSAPTTATSNAGAVTSPAPDAVTSKDKSFNFTVPQGWNLTKQSQALAYLSSAEVAHNVAPTIVISQSQTQPAPALDDVLQRAMTEARQDGGSVTKLPGRQIGGEKAVGLSSTRKIKNVNVTQIYYAVAHNSKLYTIALTAAKPEAKKAESALNSTLSSWSWSVPGKKDSTATGTTPAASPTSTSTPASPKSSSSSSTSDSSASSSASANTSSGASSRPSATSSTPASGQQKPSAQPTAASTSGAGASGQ